MQRNPTLSMAAQDLCELYSSLELFWKTYADCEDEAKRLLQCVKSIYIGQYGVDALAALQNPRGAGRKSGYSEKIREQIVEMRRQGKSYRAIARESGIPKSTIHRLMGNKEVSRN